MADNIRIEMIRTVLDRLHQSQPADYDSPLLIVTGRTQKLVWQHAIRMVHIDYRNENSVFDRRVLLMSISELRGALSKFYEPYIFIVDDTPKGVDRESTLQLLKQLDPAKGHRVFMCREALPGLENLSRPKLH